MRLQRGGEITLRYAVVRGVMNAAAKGMVEDHRLFGHDGGGEDAALFLEQIFQPLLEPAGKRRFFGGFGGVFDVLGH